MDLLADPRVPGGSTYDRTAIIKAVTEFYELLVRLLYVEPDHLLYPPEGGWPTITRESIIDEFEQTEEVYLLLKHLPYLDHSKCKYYVKDWTFPCDWRSNVLDDNELRRLERHYPQFDWFPDLPAWTIPLTHGSDSLYGSFAVLDTTDGTITETGYESTQVIHDKDYKPDDPRAWRNQAKFQWDRADITQPAVDYFRKLYDKFYTLEYIGYKSLHGEPKIAYFTDDRDGDRAKAIEKLVLKSYRDNGWPKSFDGQACRKALHEAAVMQEEAMAEWRKEKNSRPGQYLPIP